jgi:ComF family protein
MSFFIGTRHTNFRPRLGTAIRRIVPGSLSNVRASVLALLYPQRCLGCKALIEPEESFCTVCRKFILPIESPLCVCCGIPFATASGPDHLCGRCQARPLGFRQARSWALYQSGDTPHPLSQAIQNFKYHRNLSVGKTLAGLGVVHFPLEDQAYDLIVPVPLHPDRLRWRGFNQSLILARAIGCARQLKVDPFLLERIRPTVPQTQLSASERRANVRGAFAVVAPERLEEKRVLLVDDVYTSGATVEECAKVLYRAGAEVVDVFTLARAVTH